MTYVRIFAALCVLGLGIIFLYDGDQIPGFVLAGLGLALVDRWVR